MGELGSPAGQANPYAVYERIRELGETVAGPDDSLIVTGYRQRSALLRDPRLRKNPGRLLAVSGFPDWQERPALKLMFESILMINPPDHTRLRGLVAKVFTHRRVASMRPAVEKIADELLDRLEGSGDFVATVAFPFPVTVIGELLGVPAAERLQFKGLVDEWTTVLEILNAPAVDRADEAATKIIDYLQQLIELRRAEPRGDLISALVAAEQEDEHAATDEELVRLAALILGAGFETTTGLLANGLVALLEHPAQADRWRRAPELSRTRSRSCSATTHRSRSPTDAPRSTTSRSAARLCTPVSGSSRSSGRPTGIRTSSLTPTRWCWTATRASRCPSAPVSTTAWARPWPGSRARSCSRAS
jgi:cytochrome P450